MDKMHLDSADRKLLSLLQTGFPLSREPYADLGLKLGIDRDEIIHRIKQLKANGIVRQISPVLDARRLGYQPTLVAMRVKEVELERAEQFIIKHPMVSHAYEREHHFNLWFTLATSAGADMESELEQLTISIEVEVAFTLPAVKIFKIGAYFATDGDGQELAGTIAQPGKALPSEVKLSKTDKLIINEIQQDLPLTYTPFSAIAARLGMDEDYFLARCQSLKQRGIMRRFGAAINHRQAGYIANCMACWEAPPEKLDVAADILTAQSAVSHCYERETNPLWKYNLFAMIHGHTREECVEIADRVSAQTELADYIALFSTKEIKKTRVKYLA